PLLQLISSQFLFYPLRATSNVQCSYTSFFFFNDTATTEIYTLSLHDALPILNFSRALCGGGGRLRGSPLKARDRKSTRLNSSHVKISYAVFCLKKKKKSN